MDMMPFVIWMVFYPLVASISSYIANTERLMCNREPYSPDTNAISSIISLIIWISIGIKLFNNGLN